MSNGNISGDSLIFVGGAGRSGTTLMRVMLNAHPSLCAGPEFKLVPSIAELYRQMKNMRDTRKAYNLTESDIRRSFALFVNSLFEGFRKCNGAKKVVEKTPHNVLIMKELVEILPQAKFIHVVRDGRDVACSLTKMNWTDFRGRILPYVENIENAIRYWVQVVSRALQDAKHPSLQGKVMIVHYEELVCHPEEVMREVLTFLDEPWIDDVLNYTAVKRENEPVESSTGQVAHKPYSSSIGRWRREFDSTNVNIVKGIAGRLLIELGYEKDIDW